jgi:hypothetical protein
MRDGRIGEHRREKIDVAGHELAEDEAISFQNGFHDGVHGDDLTTKDAKITKVL